MDKEPDTFLIKAAQCERKATRALEDGVKATYLDLAAHWRGIAREKYNLKRLQGELHARSKHVSPPRQSELKVPSYKQHAANCRKLATHVKRPEHVKQLEEMAQEWDTLARLFSQDHAK